MRRRKPNKTWIALAGTFLFHLGVIGVGVLFVVFSATANLVQSLPPEPEPISITLVDTPEEKPKATTAQPTPPPRFVRTTAEQETQEPPKNTNLESDRDTKAATEDQAYVDGIVGATSVKAKKRDWEELTDQTYAPSSAPLKAAPTPPPKPEAKQEPVPTPSPEPSPIPTPSPQKQPTPEPKASPEPKPTPNPEAIALLKKQKSQQPQTAKLSSKPASLESGRPTETAAAEVRGTISAQGRTATDATATPLGKYKSQVYSIIEQKWRFYVHGKADLMKFGSVKIRFYVNAQGRVQNLQLIENSSNESFASYTVRAITESKLPQIPDDVRALLSSGRVEFECNFILFAQ